jgi:hypothetical protein
MIKPDRPSLARAARRGRLAVPVVALALAAGTLAACGSAASGGTGGASPPPSPLPGDGATFHGTIYVSGQVHNKPTTWHLTKTFTERVPTVQNCTEAAKSGMAAGIFRVPSPTPPLPEANIEITGFRGPGTYPPPALKHDKADTIVLGQNGGMQSGTYIINKAAHGVAQGKEVLFLNKDGSGELVYSQAHLDGRAASPALAGLISWSCTS